MKFRKVKYYDSVYSRNNLPKIKDGAYVINLDEYRSIRNHWIALYVNVDNVTYFGVLNIFQEKLKNSRQQKYYKEYLWNRSS